MADGKELRSHVLGLAYYDTASGKSVLIAELKDCQGEILGSNQVVYADAFNGVSADVRFRYTRAGMEQDVILRKQPPAPEAFGLASSSSVLQVWTEFLAAPTPNITAIPAVAGSSSDLPDQSLDFGAMRMIEGQAFLAGQDPLQSVRTAKQWIMTDGRSILVESVRVPAITGQLAQLPLSSRANLKPAGSSPLYAVSAKRLLPAPPGMKVAKKEMAFAGQTPLNQGLLLDYLIVENGTGPTVFQGDTTYFVSGPVYCQNVTLEGAVIKYPNDTTAYIRISGTLTCQTAQYRPAIFTAGDDDSVGQSLSGVWQNWSGVVSGYYANPALYFQTSISQTLSHIRVAYANLALAFVNGACGTISDAQLVNCAWGLLAWNGGVTLENALFSNMQKDLILYPIPGHLTAVNVTFDRSAYLCSGVPGDYFTATNCIVANVTNASDGNVGLSGNHNGFYKSPEFGSNPFTNTFYPFQAAGAGNYYLTNGCNFFLLPTS
jgi:hypothetical protein